MSLLHKASLGRLGTCSGKVRVPILLLSSMQVSAAWATDFDVEALVVAGFGAMVETFVEAYIGDPPERPS